MSGFTLRVLSQESPTSCYLIFSFLSLSGFTSASSVPSAGDSPPLLIPSVCGPLCQMMELAEIEGLHN